MSFGEFNASRIGVITTAGVISEFRTRPPSPGRWASPAGPGGTTIWFCEYTTSKLGKIQL